MVIPSCSPQKTRKVVNEGAKQSSRLYCKLTTVVLKKLTLLSPSEKTEKEAARERLSVSRQKDSRLHQACEIRWSMGPC